MTYRQSSFDYYPNSNYPDDDMDQAQLPSFEVIHGAGRPEQIYRRDDSPVTMKSSLLLKQLLRPK